MRADLAAVLNGCPIADETILVASELATNAVVHSSSRLPGGRFIVRAEVHPGDYVWVEVEDQGGPWARQHHSDDRPHGLDIVRAIAGDANWGIDGDATIGHVTWARLDWRR
jgi:two-component sensor histidine kinase